MKRRPALMALLVLTSLTGAARGAEANSPFAYDNLIAWCVVPFDAARRGPQERAAMLQRLAFRGLAYDWRQEHVPTFDAELEALKQHHVKLHAFWMPSSLQPREQEHIRTILDLMGRHGTRAQLWVMLDSKALEALPDDAARLSAASLAIAYLADEAAKVGCTIGLYNHGGWFGEPENQIAIIRSIGRSNVGIVYNLHHAHHHLDRLPQVLASIKGYLLTLNLNGMTRDGAKILPVGMGADDRRVLQVIRDSGYRGPVGILDHRNELDAEVSLKQNLAGLRRLLEEAGDEAALKSWPESQP